MVVKDMLLADNQKKKKKKKLAVTMGIQQPMAYTGVTGEKMVPLIKQYLMCVTVCVLAYVRDFYQ